MIPLAPKKENKENPNQLGISEILPLGYLYLLVLGILAESVYYGLLGINFLSYASILDVLLGPIAILTDNLILLGLLLAVGTIFYFLMKRTSQKLQKTNPEKVSLSLTASWLFVMSIMILSAFVGYGLGGGLKMRDNIANNDIKHNITLHFLDGEKRDVCKLGNTGTFLFYIEKDQKNIRIAPIANNIKEIEYK
jgi:hypothetical protein